MQTNERHEVRQSFLDMGFNRNGYSADTSGVGDYTETWTHPDGSVIEIQWSPRTSIAGTTSNVTDAPGMYDEPDMGISLPIGVSDEEDRIPSGLSGAQVNPESLRFALNQHVTIIGVETDDPEATGTASGYPVDVWRFSETALAVLLSTVSHGTGGKAAVLTDDTTWSVVPTNNPDQTFRHYGDGHSK